jgi:predicted ester cyclase
VPARQEGIVTREETFALFTRREGLWRAHDAQALAEGHTLHGVVVSPTGGVLEGRPEIERIYRVWFDAFPDLIFGTEDLIIDDDRVALLARATGTHSGTFFGVGPTGRRIEISAVFLYRLESGLIAHERRILDFTGLLVQVGVLRAKPVGGL